MCRGPGRAARAAAAARDLAARPPPLPRRSALQPLLPPSSPLCYQVMPLGSMNDFEKAAMEAMLPELKAQIQKGIDFATKA